MTLLPAFTVGEFRKAARSSPNQNCVRVARKQGWTAVWDDKRSTAATTPVTTLPNSELLLLTDAQFDTYQAAVRAGDSGRSPLNVTRRTDGMYIFRITTPSSDAAHTDVELVFDQDELDAFHDGVFNHEFDHA
jgi:hypothetical protein